MKQLLITLTIILTVLSAYSQPKVNIILKDGSNKQYNLTEINQIKISAFNDKTMMKVFYEDSLTENYLTKEIEKISFESDQSKYEIMNIYVNGIANKFILKDLDSINFFVLESPVPKIESINPTIGKIGDEVVLKGINFGISSNDGAVSFKGKNATDIKLWSDTLIKVLVPQGAISGKIAVIVKGIKSNEVDFKVLSYLISLTPASGRINEIITVNGSNFSSSQGSNFVLFNDSVAKEIVFWSDLQVKVKIPEGAKSGKVFFNVDGIKTNGLDFIVLPKLESIFPNSAKIGDTVLLSGSGFSILKDSCSSFFSGKKATEEISRSSTKINVRVPVGTKSGKVYIISGGNKSNEIDFSVIPHIAKVSPDSAGVGDEIIITGSGFGDQSGTSKIDFNGNSFSEFTSWTDTKIIMLVPAGAVTGPLHLVVSEITSNDVKFTVIQHLTAITPNTAKIGDIVSITGTNFGPSRGSNFVLLNTKQLTDYITWSDNEIKFKIPDNTNSCKVFVQIGEKKSNSADLIIIPQITLVNPNNGRAGGSVTFSGNGFGDSQEGGFVSFNGGSAMDIQSWTTTSISLKIPAGAKTGKVSVTQSNQKSNELDFTILPTISNIYPISGLPGDQVTLTGISFGGTRDASTVSFKGASATSYISWSDTEIRLNVPNGSQTGKVYITVGTEKSNEVDFYLTPVINNLSPSSAKIGDLVTINGSNFGDTRGTSTIVFNTATVSNYQSWSNTSVSVLVPAGTRTGKVSMLVNNIKSNEVDFTDTDIFYETTVIGTQEWMVKNLDSARYRNGDVIPEVSDATEWANLTTGAWCYFNNDQGNGAVYGKIYNWYAINDPRGIGPQGWHVPSDAEWTTLNDYLQGSSVAGGKMKETGTSHWSSPNTGATNETGFTGLGGGYRIGTGAFQQFNNAGSWWSRTESDASNAYHRIAQYNNAALGRYANGKVIGFYVRMLKD